MAKTNRRPPEVTRTVTHEGGAAWRIGKLDELALTAVSTYLGERTFYESASDREGRLIELTRFSTAVNPAATARLIAATRQDYNVRTAALVMAVEYLRAGGPNAREVIASVIRRPDEPAEVLAYWQARYGADLTKRKRNLVDLPWALRQGVADGIVRTYNEAGYLKYRGGTRPLVTMGDAIELTHPRPKAEWQRRLFKYILDEKHGAARPPVEYALPLLATDHQFTHLRPEDRNGWLLSNDLPPSVTWERLSGWLGGEMTQVAWSAVVPNMGVMALLRNLRNFDQVGLPEAVQSQVEAKLTDPEEVSASRIFPYRVYSAYRQAPSDRWKHALGKTLDYSMVNVPSFDRTLFLVDVSGSMTDTLSGRSEMMRYEVAVLMGLAAWQRSTNSDLGLYAVHSTLVSQAPGASTMGLVTKLIGDVEAHIIRFFRHGAPTWGSYRAARLGDDPLVALGQGTNTHEAIRDRFDPARHDRVIVFTDDQAHDNPTLSGHVPEIVYFNLGGYSPVSDWGRRRIHIGGYSDAAFNVISDLAARS